MWLRFIDKGVDVCISTKGPCVILCCAVPRNCVVIPTALYQPNLGCGKLKNVPLGLHRGVSAGGHCICRTASADMQQWQRSLRWSPWNV